MFQSIRQSLAKNISNDVLHNLSKYSKSDNLITTLWLLPHSSVPDNIHLALKYWNKHLSDNLGSFLYYWWQLIGTTHLIPPWSLHAVLVGCSSLSKCHLVLFGTIFVVLAILHQGCRFMFTVPKKSLPWSFSIISLVLVIICHACGVQQASLTLWHDDHLSLNDASELLCITDGHFMGISGLHSSCHSTL